ncbi:MRP3s1 protein [Martensiomyces pterosporus]|nr:MRP3s1 protein [Martensiomyces pterosporus]
MEPEGSHAAESVQPPSEWPTAGKIEFRNYSMRYRQGEDLVLKDVSLTIHPGEKIGIVGRTGAGKSSLARALFRLYEGASGSILVDGEDISKLDLGGMRPRIGIIPQDSALFGGTVRGNLDPLCEFTIEDMWAALIKSIGLRKHVGYGGGGFSAGQRQLFSLCRALMRKRKILVLDEATADVDLETDRAMHDAIHTEFKDCTILTIAHRLDTVMSSDRIIVMDQGRVAEFDTPENLIAKGGLFAQLVESNNIGK